MAVKPPCEHGMKRSRCSTCQKARWAAEWQRRKAELKAYRAKPIVTDAELDARAAGVWERMRGVGPEPRHDSSSWVGFMERAYQVWR